MKKMYLIGFDVFWRSYPKKIAKGAAIKSWSKISPDDELLKKILAAIDSQKKSDQWSKANGQYIPYPATWLNQMRWEDEIDYKQSGVSVIS